MHLRILFFVENKVTVRTRQLIRQPKRHVTSHILPIGQNISPDNVGFHREAISHFRFSGNISLLSTFKLTADGAHRHCIP